ncbi:UvrD-helicase domain-containing protein [Pseudomonas aeruginosa]
MILCRQPLARIFAGAGSGKSTTLVLRVVFMLCHLGVEPQRLTVISFTNASCAQLREQLLRLLAHWQYPFDAAQARQCVRTFHSALGSLAREVLGNPRWFEQLDDRDPAAEPDNPLATGRLRPAQQRLLKQAYQQCYAESPAFRAKTHKLLELPPPAEPEEGARRQPKAPLEPFKLAGEFQALPLYEAFHAQAGFAESLGLRVERLDSGRLECGLREKIFVEAMALFWARFQALLREEGLMTFDAAFQQLGERMAGGALAETALAPFTHLLIDEFQDVSPQIVLWLQALHRRLANQGTAPSLMAIGDDWQSIYGWRGSSPELFIDFDRHFPSRGRGRKSALLVLETNYRSVEPIIRDGEKVLAGVRFKQDKTCRAFRPIQPGDHGVKLVQRFDLRAQLPKLLAEIRAQCEHAAARESSERTAVLLLSRRNEPLQAIQAELDRALPVKGMTIHRAKGLQAEVAIVVDDCLPGEKHPLRNALYAASGFFRNSYDQAMEDESLRLAYVAITRGVSRVLWYTRKAQGATALLARR